jgi:HAD superfamily hydrolase (TIGR01509 family)
MDHAVLFDMDGVLLKTEALKAQTHAQTVASFGGSVSAEFYASLMGQSQHAVSSAFMTAAGISVPGDEYTATYKKIYAQLLNEHLEMTPGAKEILIELTERGYKLALVTSSLRWMVEHIVETLELRPLFGAILCADDVTREKPAPDAYQKALSLLQLPASAAVVVEDSEAGVISGVTAGCKVIAIRHVFNQRHDFSLASRVVNSLIPTSEVVDTIQFLLNSQ